MTAGWRHWRQEAEYMSKAQEEIWARDIIKTKGNPDSFESLRPEQIRPMGS